MPAVAAVKTSIAPPAKLDPIALKPTRLPKLLLFIPGPHEQSTASARQLMRSLGWQHCVEEVDCSIHTAKAEHLASLIDRPAVPYLFFQGKTVGNLDHLNEMVLSGGFQKLANMYERWVDSGFSPLVGCECGFQLHLDPKLCLVETDVKTLGASVTSDPEHATCPVFAVPNITCDSAFCPGVNFESLTTLEILCDLLLDFAFEFVTTNKPAPTFSIIPRRITHRRSFSGKTLREYAESRYRTDSLTATNICQVLMDYAVIRHVEKKEQQTFTDGPSLCRMVTHDNPMIVNKLMMYPTSDTGEQFLPLVYSLWDDMTQLKNEFRKGQQVDLNGIFLAKRFVSLRMKSCRLRNVNVSSLTKKELPAGEANYWVAGLINLFNLTAWQGFIQLGVPSASLARQSFFSKIGVELGEHDLTLSQILNCLLRDSRKSSDGTPKPTPLALHVPFDPRIHFVLQSKYRVISSDTLIRPESLDDQLQAAAEEFVNDPFNVSLRVTELGASVLGTDPDRDALDRSPDSARSRHDYHCDLTVPKWFSVFEVDFGRDWMQILKTISPWFKREKQLVANRMLELGRNITVDLRQHQLEWSLLSAGVGKHSKYPFTEESRSDA